METGGGGVAVGLALAVYVALAALVFGVGPREPTSGACAGLSNLLDGRPAAAAATLCRLATAAEEGTMRPSPAAWLPGPGGP